MRKYLLVATSAAVLAVGGVALAQTPPPGGGPDGGQEQHREHWGERGGMMHRMNHRGDGAAFFRFRRGDAEMDIKCPGNENVQTCVTAAGSLMDKLSGMQQPKTP